MPAPLSGISNEIHKRVIEKTVPENFRRRLAEIDAAEDANENVASAIAVAEMDLKSELGAEFAALWPA
jgi:hypothetical protein